MIFTSGFTSPMNKTKRIIDATNATTTLKIYTHQFKARDIAAASMMGNFVESALNSTETVLKINEKTA